MVILYTLDNGEFVNINNITLEEMDNRNISRNLYVNLTNACPCACTFCLRQTKEMTESNSLWLKREPTTDEIIIEFSKLDLPQFKEVIFCGFGEPTERIDTLIEIAKYIKNICPSIPIRINTNGLGNLINKKEIAPLLKGLIDTVSISLNASNAEEYLKITRSRFGINSFDSLIKFSLDCKAYIPNVVFSVVDCIGEKEIQACQKLCDNLSIPLRVRAFE